jgi:transcriptional regulator with XRE-family HTH domain
MSLGGIAGQVGRESLRLAPLHSCTRTSASVQVQVDMPAGVDDDYARAIGAAIKAARRARGLSQEQLRLRVGNSKNAVSNWERGVSAPTVQNLRELCRVLRVGPEVLLGIAADDHEDPLASDLREVATSLAALRHDAESAGPDLIGRLREAEAAVRRIGGVGL